MAQMVDGQRNQIGDGTGVVPVRGDFVDIRIETGAILRLEVFERALDTTRPDGPVWLVYVRRPAPPEWKGVAWPHEAPD